MFKQFPFKQIDSAAEIKPNHEEISNFQQTLNKPSTGVIRDDSSEDEGV
jgi:hypothetical protein